MELKTEYKTLKDKRFAFYTIFVFYVYNSEEMKDYNSDLINELKQMEKSTKADNKKIK